MEHGVTELMSLLRAFVQEVPLSPVEFQRLDAALPEVLPLCRLHTIMGIWAYKVREYYDIYGVEDEDAREVYETAQKIYSRTVSQAVNRELQYQALSKMLAEGGIDHLAFKGIVVKDMYAVPQLRSFGDIDLAIRQADRQRCHKLMQKLGYTATTDFEPVYTYQKEKEMYEIHTSVMAVNITDRADYIGYFKNLWNYATEQAPHIWAFTPEFHFVYLLTHIAKHIYSSGAGIRMYLDLAFYLKRFGDTLDWQWIQAELDKLKLTEFFHLAMDAVARWFAVKPPIPIPEMEEDLFLQFETFTMEGGVFGFEGRLSGEQKVRKQGERSKALRETLFPHAKTIQARYTYLQKYPWLLPVAWVDRLVRNRRIIGKMTEKTKEIMTADEKELQEVSTFYRRIGL